MVECSEYQEPAMPADETPVVLDMRVKREPLFENWKAVLEDVRTGVANRGAVIRQVHQTGSESCRRVVVGFEKEEAVRRHKWKVRFHQFRRDFVNVRRRTWDRGGGHVGACGACHPQEKARRETSGEQYGQGRAGETSVSRVTVRERDK